jgi:hypothetical protein
VKAFNSRLYFCGAGGSRLPNYITSRKWQQQANEPPS